MYEDKEVMEMDVNTREHEWKSAVRETLVNKGQDELTHQRIALRSIQRTDDDRSCARYSSCKHT